MRRFVRARRGLGLLALMTVLALVFAAPAFAGTGPVVLGFHWNYTYPASSSTNGCRLVASEFPASGGGPIDPPFHNGISHTWGPYTNAFNINNTQTRVDYGTSPYGLQVPPGVMEPAGWLDKGFASFNVVGPVMLKAKFRYLITTTNPPYAPSIPIPGTMYFPNLYYGSVPRLENSTLDVDDNGNVITNTTDMVYTNVKFAMSPTALADDVDYSDPAVEALFAASPDTNRPGPYVVHPGQEVVLATPPGIGDSQAGGQTLLMRCSVADSDGNAQPFLVQFAVPGSSAVKTPASSVWSLALFVFAGLLVAGGLMRRTQNG